MVPTVDSGGGDMQSRIDPYIVMGELDQPIELVKGPLHLKGPTEVTIASDLTFQCVSVAERRVRRRMLRRQHLVEGFRC